MKKTTNFNFLEPISAVLPAYDENGNNVCQVIYMTGERTIVGMCLATFLNRWTFMFGVHLGAQRMWAREILDLNNRLPLLINSLNAFIPIKTMKPIGLKDSCHGFIHQGSIKDFDETGISLHNGIRIPCFSTKKNIKRKINQADYLLLLYRDKHMAHQGVYNNPSLDVARQLSLFYDFLRDDPPQPPSSY